MIKRTLALIAGTLLGGLLLATPAHATPVPSPSPSPTPTATTPANPCALPSPTATLEELPQVEGKALDMRGRPRLPLPVACFVTIKDLCEGESQVTLHNPIPHIVIKYRVADEDTTRTVSFGETETTTVSSSLSPWSVWIVLDDEGSHKFLVTRHHYREPKGCQTASPSPSVSPSESPEPQLPVTGRDLSVPLGLAGGATALLTAIGVVALVRRRRSAA
jgi:LPXTG-motif cell wall-anchored protein